MMRMEEQEIRAFLSKHEYDVRKTHNGRWIDQKCTMDVVCMVSDCIMEYTANNPECPFTVRDIWYSDYSVSNVQRIFSKPNPAQKADREYDKYFGQPIRLLDAAGIIRREKQRNLFVYSIVEPRILEYISFRERNSYAFLCLYIEKVLKDSGIFELFEAFFRLQDKNSFQAMKDGYTKFMIENTPINGKTECARIFTKVLNPLACKYGMRGTERGFLSKDIITQDMLLYNRKNWRDLLSEKPKGETRTEYEVSLLLQNGDEVERYKIDRAKRHLKSFNDRYRDGKTELYDERHSHDKATQMHHIFPVSDYPMIAQDMENLIALTPTQHLSYAHPDNNTHYINRYYQRLCLIAKTESIMKNLLQIDGEPIIYDFSSYLKVLNYGFNTDEFNEVHEMDFEDILRRIDRYYM